MSREKARGETLAIFESRFPNTASVVPIGSRDRISVERTSRIARHATDAEFASRGRDGHEITVLLTGTNASRFDAGPSRPPARAGSRRSAKASGINHGNFTPRYDASQINVRSAGSRFENSQLDIVRAHDILIPRSICIMNERSTHLVHVNGTIRSVDSRRALRRRANYRSSVYVSPWRERGRGGERREYVGYR